MRRTSFILLVVAICISCTAGCFLLDERHSAVQTPVITLIPSPTPESGMATLDPSAMALQLTDLPAGYIIRERADIAFPDVSSLAREQGWKKGYSVSFYRMNAEKYDITAVSQRIGVYQIDGVHSMNRTMEDIFEATESELLTLKNASVTVTEIPVPRIGDQTGAFRIIDANDAYGVVKYVIIFTKKNVIEAVEMRGTTTDYEVLKGLAGKGAGKIR